MPNGVGPFPAMVCIHGMKSNPELVCGLGESPDYTRNFGVRAVEKGYVVFAPYDVNSQEGRRWLDRKAYLTGGKLQGLKQYKIERVVDYLSQQPRVNAKKIGAYGISWGGRTVDVSWAHWTRGSWLARFRVTSMIIYRRWSRITELHSIHRNCRGLRVFFESFELI